MKLSIAFCLAALLAAASAFAPGTSLNRPADSGSLLRMSSVADAPADTPADTPAEDDQAAAAPAASSDANIDVAKGDRQPMYGNQLDLPETYVMCGRCKTAYALQPEDLGTRGKGRRIECTICHHSWYQARDRLFTINSEHKLVPAPEHHVSRINSNIAADRPPAYTGNCKFYVGNLDFYTSAEDLREVFAEKGVVGDVNIITEEDGRSRGFAFVTMMTEEDGKGALELDGADVGGRNIVVRPPNN